MRSSRHRRGGLSFVEVLLALAVVATLAVTVYGLMISTLRGVVMDRASEMKRHLVLDLLERFCHPYSDIDSLFSKNPPNPAERELSIAEAVKLVSLPAEEADITRQILESSGVTGFQLIWHRRLAAGLGKPLHALRMDRLWCKPVVTRVEPGAQVASFRVFYVRGAQ